MNELITRRALVEAGAGFAFASILGSKAVATPPVYLADMHYHLFFAGNFSAQNNPLGPQMARGHATLVAWSFVSDVLWMGRIENRYRQKAIPKPGEPYGWFQREINRIKRHVADQNLKLVLDSSDVDRALNGAPHVVLATEGSFFLEGELSRLSRAYQLGVRHVQLVHYLRNEVGDYQTERPEHQGLTEFGRRVIAECNRLGILIDLAHCTEEVVMQALEISSAPMVWSHGSISTRGRPHWSMMLWRARQLTLPTARQIAKKGGVVGLWALTPDVGDAVSSYARRILQMADQLGEDHVGFGTDFHGLGKGQMLAGYADLQSVVQYLQARRVPRRRVQKIAIGNYARVLKSAMQARSA